MCAFGVRVCVLGPPVLRRNLVRSFLISSGLHLPETFPEAPWVPALCRLGSSFRQFPYRQIRNDAAQQGSHTRFPQALSQARCGRFHLFSCLEFHLYPPWSTCVLCKGSSQSLKSTLHLPLGRHHRKRSHFTGEKTELAEAKCLAQGPVVNLPPQQRLLPLELPPSSSPA